MLWGLLFLGLSVLCFSLVYQNPGNRTWSVAGTIFLAATLWWCFTSQPRRSLKSLVAYLKNKE